MTATALGAVSINVDLINLGPGISAERETWTITCTRPANTAPTAEAGPAQTVASGAAVTLAGSGSDGDLGDSIASYAWTQTAGTAVTLTSGTSPTPGFTAPSLNVGDPAAVLTFSLIVTDTQGVSSVADTVTITVDGPPSVTLSGAPAALSGIAPFTVTATFSENVTGFNDLASDVTIANASVTAISGGGSVYTLTVTPTGAGDVSITIPAAAAQDAVNNPNAASNTLVIGNTVVKDTQEAIANFMLDRANNLASNQPGLTRFLQGNGCGSFNADGTDDSGSVNGCFAQGNIWTELNGSWSGSSSYMLLTLGAHSFVNPDFLIGGMVQFDHAVDNANTASGTGWMVGPYFVAKHTTQPVYLEGRLLYGQTKNDISPLGAYTDSFETERWLAQLRMTGEYKYQATTLMPLFDFTYTNDTQLTYVDSLGNSIPGQTVDLTQLQAGLDFSTPLPVQSGALNLTGGLSAIYSSTNGGSATFEGGRGRTHLGLDYDNRNGTIVEIGTHYDGIGSTYEGYGLKLRVEIGF